MPKRKLCVCSLINELAILYGSKLEGEIYFKHSPKCRAKTTGSLAWTGAGFEKGGKE